MKRFTNTEWCITVYQIYKIRKVNTHNSVKEQYQLFGMGWALIMPINKALLNTPTALSGLLWNKEAAIKQ